MIKKILLCALCLSFACLGFGCEKEPEYPDFGEEGRWEYSEKLSFDFGANEHGLSLEEYIDRANEAAAVWPKGMICYIPLNDELITGETEYAFEDEALNAFLTRMKAHELLIREAYGLPETGDVTEHKDYKKYMRMTMAYGCAEFLDFPDMVDHNWSQNSLCWLIAVFREVPEELTAGLVALSESPLVESVSLSLAPWLVDA